MPPKKSPKAAPLKKATAAKKKKITRVKKTEPVISEMPPLVHVEEVAVFEQPPIQKTFFFHSPNGEVFLKATTTLLNRVVLFSSVTVYIIAFILAGLSAFAGATANTSVPPTGPLGAELVKAGDAISGGANSAGLAPNIGIVIAKFIAFFFGALGMMFACFIFYAGFVWLTAAGEEKKVDHAKAIIFHSILGLVVSFASFVLANAWVDGLVKAVTP